MLNYDPRTDIPEAETEDRLKELASLARLVTFARERAHEVQADFPAYCLDLALGALLQEVYRTEAGPEFSAEDHETWMRAVAH